MSITFSSIKNETALKTNIEFNDKCKMRKLIHCYNASYPIPLASNYDNTITAITIGARTCSGRRFELRAKTNPRMRTYSIRLDAGCIMSDYKD